MRSRCRWPGEAVAPSAQGVLSGNSSQQQPGSSATPQVDRRLPATVKVTPAASVISTACGKLPSAPESCSTCGTAASLRPAKRQRRCSNSSGVTHGQGPSIKRSVGRCRGDGSVDWLLAIRGDLFTSVRWMEVDPTSAVPRRWPRWWIRLPRMDAHPGKVYGDAPQSSFFLR